MELGWGGVDTDQLTEDSTHSQKTNLPIKRPLWDEQEGSIALFLRKLNNSTIETQKKQPNLYSHIHPQAMATGSERKSSHDQKKWVKFHGLGSSFLTFSIPTHSPSSHRIDLCLLSPSKEKIIVWCTTFPNNQDLISKASGRISITRTTPSQLLATKAQFWAEGTTEKLASREGAMGVWVLYKAHNTMNNNN